MIKRRLVKLGLLLIVGAIINVAVAWGFALTTTIKSFGDQKRTGFQSKDMEFWQVFALKKTGATCYSSIKHISNSSTVQLTDPSPDQLLPRWAVKHEISINQQGNNIINGYGYGWPNVSLCGFLVQKSTSEQRQVERGIELSSVPWRARGANPDFYLLPCKPIWPGFAINTIFCAAIVWLLFFAPFKLRRLRRIKRGLCPKCAYDLRGGSHDACAECGHVCGVPHIIARG